VIHGLDAQPPHRQGFWYPHTAYAISQIQLALSLIGESWRRCTGAQRSEGGDRREGGFALSIESAAKKGTAAITANSSGVETEERVTRLNVGKPAEWFSLYRRSPGIIFAGSIAVVFAVGYLLVAPMGRDLSAQLAHAALARQHWLALLDLRWYGGFDPVGYSVLSPAVMALLGVRLTTALAYVASVVLFAALLKHTAVTRPRLGAIAGAVCMAGNLVVTRTPFTLGLAVALGALLALASGRLHITAVLAVLAALCSPVAGLFLGVAGGALFLSGQRRGGITVATAGLVPTIVVGFVFGNGGYQTFGLKQALISFLVCLVVAGMCWRTPVVRWGALLSAGMVAGAYLIPTPCRNDRDTSARAVRCADYRCGRFSPSGGRHCSRRSRGFAVAAGIRHRGARTRRSRPQRELLRATPGPAACSRGCRSD
jgi:hypothetical protein